MDKVRQLFIAEAKKANILSTEELYKIALKKKWAITYAELRNIRAEWMPSAVRRASIKPSNFSTFQVQ